MLKTILLLLLLLFSLSNLSAQVESNIKLKIEIGILADTYKGKIYVNGHFLHFLYVEPKVKTSKNTFIGLRIGTAQNSQGIVTSDPNQFYINNDVSTFQNLAISFVPTYDYYFIKNKFRPYLGLGFGYYFLSTNREVLLIGNSSDVLEINVNNQLGFLLRGGLNLHELSIGRFDLSNFSVGLEFNYIPVVDAQIPNGQVVGTLNTSNIGLTIGYTIGLRKSSK